MRRIALLLAGALLLSVALPGVVAAKPKTATPYPVPVTGSVTLPDNVTPGGTLTNAQYEITRFAQSNGGIVALGTLTGTLTPAVGSVTQLRVPVTIPVTATTENAAALAAAATCPILHLTLGPLDLNLLGLVVHLDQVVLNIDAQSGPGNLLGNLLCAVAGLLDGTGSLGGIAALLNRILMILQQL
jgi:hypothetical protein